VIGVVVGAVVAIVVVVAVVVAAASLPHEIAPQGETVCAKIVPH
jgi:hypothetical protein